MRKFSLVLLVLLFCGTVNSFALNKSYIEKRIKNVQSALLEKKAGYLKLRDQYRKLRIKTRRTKLDIKRLKVKIDASQAGLKRLNRKISLLKKDIKTVGAQLSIQKQELYSEFNKYYEYSMTGDYYKKGVWYIYMNSFIIKYMQNKIKSYVSKRTYLKNKLNMLKVYVNKKKKILSRIQAQNSTLNRQNRQLALLLKESVRKRRAYLKQIKQLSIEQDRLQSILSKIIKEEREKALAAAKRRKKISPNKKNVLTIKQKNVVSRYAIRKSFNALKGSLMPPVRGKIIDTFGKKYDTLFRVYTRNDGIDIMAHKGECVKCIYPGKVDYVGRLSGYGGVIIINHLNGYYTVYGGVNPSVKVGENVKMYECIGNMETDKLHFELRRHSKAVNPLELLNRRYLR